MNRDDTDDFELCLGPLPVCPSITIRPVVVPGKGTRRMGGETSAAAGFCPRLSSLRSQERCLYEHIICMYTYAIYHIHIYIYIVIHIHIHIHIPHTCIYIHIYMYIVIYIHHFS